MRLMETVHGHAGVLAAVALLHPAILLRKGKPLTRRNRWSVWLTSLTVCAAFATGLWIYPHYRSSVRAGLFLRDVRAGLLFETKEHLAYAVIASTLGAATCALLAPKDGRQLRRGAALAFALGATLCLITAALGSYVSAVFGFGAGA